MKIASLVIVIVCLVMHVANASSDLVVKVENLDGLTLRLSELRVGPGMKSGDAAIDLTSTFRELGIGIPEGGSLVYHAGVLVCNLDAHAHELVEVIIEGIYKKDNLIASCRAYYKLLEPLSADERLQMVLRIGFLPDPLIAAMAREIVHLRDLPKPFVDPFVNTPPQPKPLTEAETARLKQLEGTASKLLEISMHRIKEQLDTIDSASSK